MKTILLIDGPNLHAAAKTLKIEIDYARLLEYFSDGLLRAYYYTATLDDNAYASIRPLIDWLSYNRFSLVTKQAKQWTDVNGRVKTKGNMDTEIAVDALELAFNGAINHAVFFSGDGDFRYLLLALQRRGVVCTVVSSIITQPAICADELRRTADFFIELDAIRVFLERERDQNRVALVTKKELKSRWG